MKWLDALGVSESYQVPDAMMKALGIEHAETMPEHFEQDRAAMAEDTK